MKSNIEYRGIPFTVRWDYTPGSSGTDDYPGYPEEAEIIRVFHKDTDFTNFFTEDQILEIEQILLK